MVDHLQRLAMFVRDRTSNDMWRVLSRLNERLAMPATSLVLLAGDATAVLNETLLGLAAFHGLARENMTRAQAWRFLDMGLRLERAIYLWTLLDATLRSPQAEDPSLLEAVLEVADSSITFRSRYNLLPHLPAVFDLVLLDDKNPRSVLFQVNQLTQHFEYLPRDREAATAPANLWRLPGPAKTDGRARTGRPPGQLGGNRVGPRHRGDADRMAPAVGWHRRGLFCAFSHLPHGTGKRTMTYHIIHRTIYEYAAPVTVSHHVARLEPRATTQERDNFSLKIFPEPALAKTADYFGNRLCFFTIQQVHSRLEIITSSRVTVRLEKSPANESAAPWESVAEMFRDPVSPEVVEPYQFIFDSPQVRASLELADYAGQSFPAGTPLLVGAGIKPADFFRLQIRSQGDHGGDAAGGGLGKAPGRLPGLCASGHRLPAFARPARALCERLSCARARPRAGTSSGGGCFACVVRDFLSRHGLD